MIDVGRIVDGLRVREGAKLDCGRRVGDVLGHSVGDSEGGIVHTPLDGAIDGS